MALQRVIVALLLLTTLRSNDGCIAACYCGVAIARNAALKRYLRCSVAMAVLQRGGIVACNTPTLLWKCCNAMLLCCCGNVVTRCCGVALAML